MKRFILASALLALMFSNDLVAHLEADLVAQFDSGDKNQKSNACNQLWYDGTLREKYFDKLSVYLIQQFDVCDEINKYKFIAAGMLWNYPKSREIYRSKLEAYFITKLDSDDAYQKTNALQNLWFDPTSQETYRDKLLARQIANLESGDDISKYNAYYCIKYQQNLTEAQNNKINAYHVAQLDSADENRKSEAVAHLWDDRKSKETHRAKLEAHLVALLDSVDEQKKLEAFRKLWNDRKSKETQQAKLEAHLVAQFDSDDENKKSGAVANLWYDPKLKEIHRAKLETYLVAQLDSADENKKSEVAQYLWIDENAREKYRNRLEIIFVAQLQSTDDYARREAFRTLWRDSKSKVTYRSALETYLLAELGSDNIYSMTTSLSYLWHDDVSRVNHRDRLDAFIRDKLCSQVEGVIEAVIRSLLYAEIKFDERFTHLLFTLIDETQNYATQVACLLLLVSDKDVFEREHARIKAHFDRIIQAHHYNYHAKLYAYLAFGEAYKTGFDEFILQWLRRAPHEAKEKTMEVCLNVFGDENPRIQEFLIVFAREGNAAAGRQSPIAIYADLCRKVNEPFEHHPSTLRVTFKNEQGDDDDDGDGIEHQLNFTINPKILSYVPVTQVQLANIHDVDAILGEYKKMDAQIVSVRENPVFEKFFASSTEEAVMLQAMVKRYRTMEQVAGLKAMVKLMHDMYQCKTGMNQAIWDHYSVESLPPPKAGLEAIEMWKDRLSDTANPYVTERQLLENLKMSRTNLLALIENMTTEGHLFQRHLTELKTDDAERVKALFGTRLALESDTDPEDRALMGEFLLVTLGALKALSDPKTFYTQLNMLCVANDVYLPANKFGDLLSEITINDLIDKLKASDVEGRGELAVLQDEMRTFVKSPAFKERLGDFKSESGILLRTLMDGFVSNGWAGGLLNLTTLCKTEKLDAAIKLTYDSTKIDDDQEMSWRALTKVALGELQGLKRYSINALTNRLMGKNGAYAERPHERNYVDSLLGGAIGLRHAHKLPKFDSDMAGLSSEFHIESMQQVLDMFHEDFTPEKIVRHFNQMLGEEKLSIIDGMTGSNVIWTLVLSAAEEFLLKKNLVDKESIKYMLYQKGKNAKDATTLAMALLLSHIGILEVTKVGL